jgi:valyl-tRNA synthetase
MRFDLISEKLYSLIWDDFCAKYLEICKYQLTKYNESTESFLINVLERILAMLHPLMPFITAEIWSLIKDKLKRPELELTDRMYPKLKALNANNKEANTALDVIDTINQFRGKFQLPRKQTITFYTNEEIAEKETINNITNSIFIIKKSELPNIKVDKYVFAYDLVKKDNLSPAEKGKKILKLSNKIVSYENKFKNAKFMSNAPKEIIEKEQKELLLLKEELNTLQAPE